MRRFVTLLLAAALIVTLLALRPLIARRSSLDHPGESPVDNTPPAAQGRSLPAGYLGGIVEGFYGPPWSATDTLAMIRFLADHGLNTFVYAPKDDPFQRARWRDPYPEDELKQLADLVVACARERITFVYSLSPGLSIEYSNSADSAALAAKFDQLRSVGVHAFMLSFDDIEGKLDAADAKAFGNDLALAQASVANAAIARQAAVDEDFQLILAPTVYSGVSDNPYWQSLRTHLDRRVLVIWTGPHVLSKTITVDQVKTVERLIGHKLIIWDNYPTNDYTYAQTHRPKLFLGPLVGRDPGVPGAVAGYWFNPMLQPRASELAIATGAEYLLDPTAYDPSTAWDHAIHQLGGAAGSALRALAETASTYYYDNSVPQKLAADLAQVWGLPANADLARTEAYRDFAGYQQLSSDLAALPDAALYAELSPWLDALAQQGQVGQLALATLQAKRQKGDASAQIRNLTAALTNLKKIQYSIAGDAIVAFADKVLQQ